MEQLKDSPKIDDFKKEDLELNTLLAQQHVVFCQKMTIINDVCNKRDSLMNQSANLRTNFDDIDDKITECITWQDSAESRK